MLRHLEPDHSVTGGAWYSDNGFETEYVDVLNQQCFNFLEQRAAGARESLVDPMGQRNASFVSSKDLWKYITELGISKVGLWKTNHNFSVDNHLKYNVSIYLTIYLSIY